MEPSGKVVWAGRIVTILASLMFLMSGGMKLVGGAQVDPWLFVEPVVGHGLGGEPPRNIVRGDASYGLQRRGQASAAGIGRHHQALSRYHSIVCCSPSANGTCGAHPRPRSLVVSRQ